MIPTNTKRTSPHLLSQTHLHKDVFHFIPKKQKKMKQPFFTPSAPLYRKVELIPETFYKVCAAVSWLTDIRIQTAAQHRGGPGGLQVDITFNSLWQ